MNNNRANYFKVPSILSLLPYPSSFSSKTVFHHLDKNHERNSLIALHNDNITTISVIHTRPEHRTPSTTTKKIQPHLDPAPPPPPRIHPSAPSHWCKSTLYSPNPSLYYPARQFNLHYRTTFPSDHHHAPPHGELPRMGLPFVGCWSRDVINVGGV